MVARIGFIATRDATRTPTMIELATADPEIDLDVIDAGLSTAEKAARCATHEMLIMGERIPKDVLDQCIKLKFLQLMSAGFDNLDVAGLMSRGVQIANNSAAIAIAVAEHAFTLTLAVKRRLVENWLSLHENKWDALVHKAHMSELTGSTVGIVGLGHIGREVAKRLAGWEVTLLYCDAFPAPAEVERALGVTRVSLDELLARSDVITLHVPLNAQTRHIISSRELRLCKPTAILINTCRGPVVDEAALCDALRDGRILGAGLDVFETEPPRPDNPLLNMDNVIATPHIAGTSVQRVRRAAASALANAKRVSQGLAPLSLIRPEQD